MSRALRVCATLAGSVACASFVLAQEIVPSGAGWTGATDPEDVIAARQALMGEIERLIAPIDTFVAVGSGSPAELSQAAATMAPMLLAVPHLFPPTTDLYDPDAALPATLALPAVWESFPTFYRLAGASYDAAVVVAGASDAEAVKAAGLNLRATCDACHAIYLRPYVPESVSDEDLEFDFDSVLSPD